MKVQTRIIAAAGAGVVMAGLAAGPALASTHTVQPGDTLSGIAHEHLGSSGPKSIQRILDANPGVDPKRLQVGMSLKLPSQP